jgi:hypothetical protein
MKSIPSFVSFLVLSSFCYGATPDVESIDYSNPQTYLAISDSLGNRKAIIEQASKLKGESEVATIRNVVTWMDQTLQYKDSLAYRWRNYDEVLRSKCYGGCADYGIVCGVLLKGAGIPVVWVKTMDVAWIWDFKKGRSPKSWSGHVFLEVFVNGKWSLLDPGGKKLYQDYSPKMRILPGQRFAYDKGDDPKAMIMSLQWEEWKEQTAAYFRQLDESLLPVDEKGFTPLATRAYIVGNSPYYQVMSQMAAEAGLQVAMSFNTQYDKYLAESQGHVLLIETHKGKPIVSREILEKYFPQAMKGLSRPSKTIEIKGTKIIFVEFSDLLRGLEEDKASEKKAEDDNKSSSSPTP